VTDVARLINGFQTAMADEGIDEHTRRRVLNRLLYGTPERPQRTVADARVTMHVEMTGSALDDTEAARIRTVTAAAAVQARSAGRSIS